VLTARLITLLAKSHGLELHLFVWIALGSEGRSEQTIATDQDNALMYQPTGAPEEKNRYLAFAREVNIALDTCGYPLCKGNIMASNPSLCLTIAEWKKRFMHWIEHGHPEDLLNAGVFFDCRGLAGNVDLLKGLRDEVKTTAARTPRFIKLLADAALVNQVPLNWLGGLETKKLGGRSVIDLKLHGTAIVVDDRVEEFSGALDIGIAGIEFAFHQLGIEPDGA
jgi:CBS domain-containing protein